MIILIVHLCPNFSFGWEFLLTSPFLFPLNRDPPFRRFDYSNNDLQRNTETSKYETRLLESDGCMNKNGFRGGEGRQTVSEVPEQPTAQERTMTGKMMLWGKEVKSKDRS